MELVEGDIDELIEFWTLLDEDRELLVGKREANALSFALLLKHYSRFGRFPRGRSDLSDAVVKFVARQLGVHASELGFYDWPGRTIEYHRNQIRGHLGFRVATISDQEKLTAWLASNVTRAERRPERVREELLAQFRAERIERPDGPSLHSSRTQVLSRCGRQHRAEPSRADNRNQPRDVCTDECGSRRRTRFKGGRAVRARR